MLHPTLGRWRLLAATVLALAALQLAGCASFAPPPPYTTEAEALAERGEPTRRWDNEDGSTTLEHPPSRTAGPA